MTKQHTLILFLWLIPVCIFAQEIKGFVYENPGSNPLPYANLVIEGTSWGAISDYNGSFLVHIRKTGLVKLHVSHIGYASVTLTLQVPETGLQNLVIQLDKQVTEISETVITATRTKRNTTDLPDSVRLFTTWPNKEMPTAIEEYLPWNECKRIDQRDMRD